MNRHLRRAKKKLLEAQGRLAMKVAQQAFSDWREVTGLAGDYALPNLFARMQDESFADVAMREVESLAEVTAGLILREHEVRMTEAERDLFLLTARRGTVGLLREMMQKAVAYTAEMAAIGDELDLARA